MTKIRRYETPSSAQLLRHVLERPELVAAVRELPGEALARLIDRIGLEDAGEIVALASTEQLSRVFDEDLWRAEHVGGDEDFQPRRFGLWLQVLAEAGDDFVAERLRAMPRDLLQLAVHRLVLVIDIDALAVEMSEGGADDLTEKALEASPHEEWEEFRLIARHAEAWDVLWSALLALDRDDHELVRDLLERCAAIDAEYIEDNGGLYAVLTSGEMLEGDLAADRADRRAAEGYVAPADARAFLELAASGQGPEGRDAITRAYFREVAPHRGVADERAATREREAAAAELSRLLLPSKQEQAAGAEAPTPPASRTPTLLEQALAELRQTDPVLASTRLEELAYLANVWVAAGSHEGRRPRPVEALEHAITVCNAGLERAVADAGDEAARVLASTPADALFRWGYVRQKAD